MRPKTELQGAEGSDQPFPGFVPRFMLFPVFNLCNLCNLRMSSSLPQAVVVWVPVSPVSFLRRLEPLRST